jgi:Ca2+-binding EF-hand superfamily protein
MKKTHFLSSLTVVGVSAALFTLNAHSEDAPGRKGKGDPRQFFENTDKNADGKLSQDEVPEQAWARLSKADANNDGGVTREELATVMKNRPEGDKGRPAVGPERPDGKGKGKGDAKAMFERSDANQDGKLTQDEVPERLWAFISKADADKDGAVTPEEMAVAAKNRPETPNPAGDKGGQMFERLDKNTDGKISEAEAPAEVWARLSKADADKDGAVSKEEMGNVMRQMGDKGRPGGKGGPGEGGPGAMFGKFDADKDDKLSESEVPGEVWAKLRNADVDADGFVSKAELGKVYSAREGRGDAPKPEKPEAKKKRPEFES